VASIINNSGNFSKATTEKLGITSDERFLALEILQKLAYAKSENAYFEIYEELKQTDLDSVIRVVSIQVHLNFLKNNYRFMNPFHPQ
jgi:predicted ATP-dependent Lon-type protease